MLNNRNRIFNSWSHSGVLAHGNKEAGKFEEKDIEGYFLGYASLRNEFLISLLSVLKTEHDWKFNYDGLFEFSPSIGVQLVRAYLEVKILSVPISTTHHFTFVHEQPVISDDVCVSSDDSDFEDSTYPIYQYFF